MIRIINNCASESAATVLSRFHSFQMEGRPALTVHPKFLSELAISFTNGISPCRCHLSWTDCFARESGYGQLRSEGLWIIEPNYLHECAADGDIFLVTLALEKGEWMTQSTKSLYQKYNGGNQVIMGIWRWRAHGQRFLSLLCKMWPYDWRFTYIAVPTTKGIHVIDYHQGYRKMSRKAFHQYRHFHVAPCPWSETTALDVTYAKGKMTLAKERQEAEQQFYQNLRPLFAKILEQPRWDAIRPQIRLDALDYKEMQDQMETPINGYYSYRDWFVDLLTIELTVKQCPWR